MKHLALAPFLVAWTLVFMAVPTLAQGEPDASCGDPTACNFNPASTADELDQCDYCSCPEVVVESSIFFESDATGLGLRIDLVAVHDTDNPELTPLSGMKTYRFYAAGLNPFDVGIATAVTGNAIDGPLIFNAPSGFYQHPFGGLTPSGIAPLLYESGFPELAFDSWVTIGIDQQPAGLGDGFATISTIASQTEDWISAFEPGNGEPGSSFSTIGSVGGGWFTIPTAPNCLPDSTGAVLIGQFTSAGDISGSLNIQFQPDGPGMGDARLNVDFTTEGLGVPYWNQPEECPCDSDADDDGICAPFDLCEDVSACNFADPFNNACLYFDDCGECGGSGFPSGTCDCEGTAPDALGICGGSCAEDLDGDGICDVIDPCIGELDACGICNGPGEVYECGCTDIPECDCDCDGNVLDALGVCGGSCVQDLDGDGICDDVDPCIGELDACGICNGPGAVFYCGCTGIPPGDCDCAGNQLDALGICGGICAQDLDGDGICDDVDPCVGTVDACGICNGPGAVFDCGCAGIPVGDCDCAGNQLDALGVCGGPCAADADGDGICDIADDCVGSPDACGVCNGPGEVYDCGCTDIPDGDCDCSGQQLDALGVCGGTCAADTDGDGVCDTDEIAGCMEACACNFDPDATDEDGSCLYLDEVGACGGTCTADADGDGICDDVDDCVGTPDACGVCNGPGPIFECGCGPIPEGDCDCDGNQLDAVGECGGNCTSDADGDGVCDPDEVVGCTDPAACNFDEEATEAGGVCFYADALGICGGDCPGDADGDGICDTEDTCFGDLDACGVCNGPGAIYGCGCTDIEPGACDCDGNMPDAIGVCDGECEADDNGNGICDDLEASLCGPGTTWDPVAGLCIGADGSNCPTDLDGNGSTGSADLLIFLSEFSNICDE